MPEHSQLDAAAFARAFGVAPEALPGPTRALIERHDFRYRRLDQLERDALILEILTRLDQGFTQVGAHRHDIWTAAWTETRERFESAGYALDALNPSFIRKQPRVRLDGDYAAVEDPAFELHTFFVYRDWLFRRWLTDAVRAYEFGSGSGFNVAALARMHPDRPVTGLDWAEPAVEMLRLIARHHDVPVSGRRFDFFAPDPTLVLESDAAVLTFCALEQVGTRFEPFLDYLLAQQPLRCLHLEPTPEFYAPDTLPDHLALRYHRQRGYLQGFYPRLRALEAEGRVRIRFARRLGVGGVFHEGYSLLVWEPVRP